MLFVLLCEKYGMGYNDFIKQPAWFIETAIMKFRVDEKRKEMQAKKIKRKHR